MKCMRKAASLLLALAMMFAMTITSFAAETGSITINGITAAGTYEIYELLDLESYDTTSGAYSYKVNSDWAGFFETSDAKDYFSIDSQGYATWIAGEEDATVAAFAQLALAYAKANDIDPVQSSEDGDFDITGDSGVFSDLELGYYLVDSSMGALCGLTTTNPDASIQAKNGIPTVDKQVIEDSTNNPAGTNTADIGQIVKFQTTINVHAGAENYVLHDKMSNGLTFKGVTEIKHIVPGVTETIVPTNFYEVVTAGLPDSCELDCTFHVVFTDEFCAHLETNDKVVVSYEAMLNRHAIVAGDGNPNETWLEFGEENFSTSDSTKTYTFGIDIVKTDSQNQLIDGAGFKIYDAATGGNEIAVVPLMNADDSAPVLDAKGNPMYRRARADETGVEIVVKDGHVTVVGFDNGTYYLEETTTPEGYNQLAARQKFIIADSSLESVFNGGIYSTGSGVHVVNKSGTMLPETGGMGTMLFISCGAAVVLGAGVLLVTKKRMSMIQE